MRYNLPGSLAKFGGKNDLEKLERIIQVTWQFIHAIVKFHTALPAWSKGDVDGNQKSQGFPETTCLGWKKTLVKNGINIWINKLPDRLVQDF